MPLDPVLSAGTPRFRNVWLLLALSIILIIVMSWFLFQSLTTLNQGSAWVSHTERVRYQLAALLQTLSDLGTGVAGYQLTHDASSFERAEAATHDVDRQLAELAVSVQEEPAEVPLLTQLVQLTQRRERATSEQRDRALRGDMGAVQAEISSGEGRRLMETCRNVIAQMQVEEKRLLDYHGAETRYAYRMVAVAIWAAAAIAIVLLATLALVSVRDARRFHRVQEELATTLRSVGDAVIATDDLGRVRFINAVAEQLTGWSNQQASGLPLEDIFNIVNEQTRAPVESPVTRVLRENTVVGLANHTELRTRDGGERPIEDSGAPIRGDDGRIHGVVLVFRDATNERAARQALIDSRDALREADQRKDVFLATLSHELRNPLAPIRTATRVLEKPNLTADELQLSRSIISRQVGHMAVLMDDLLDMSRITRGMLTIKRETVDLAALMDAAVETAQPAITAKGHHFQVARPDETIKLDADPVRLTQVIANLLTNAAKYTRPGGSITLGARHAADGLQIYVRDNGIGIPPEMLPKIFEMFSQIEPGHEYSEGGIGIGLALVRGFVELHGGKVQAHSQGPGLGSEFIVTLPAASVLAATTVVEPAVAAAAAIAGQRVLVADDNRDGAEIMAMLLEQSGHEVLVAFTGPEALSKAAEERPDVVLLDIGMPGMSGYDVARSIRAAEWGKDMLLIAVTGWGQDEDKRKAAEAGFDHHLIKPINPDSLEMLIAADQSPSEA